MQVQSYFQLISPLIFLVFACGFLVISHYAREIAASRIFALSYFLGACAFLSDCLRGLMHPLVATYLINPLYIGTAAVFSVALYNFYRGRSPGLVFGGISAFMLAGLSWYRLVDDEIVGRTIVMTFGIALMHLYTVYDLRREMTRRVDRILQLLVTLNAIQLMVRTAVALWIEGDTLTQANYASSIVAISLQFAVSVAALAIAANLFVIFGMEIVSRLILVSETDPLTGVLNRRGFERHAAALADGIAAGDMGHAIIIADVDRFKKINDFHGHEAGDKVITHFARILSCLAREEDFVVRWGGEEFMIVMPQSDMPMARLYAESARSVLEMTNHDCLGGEAVTASFGVAVWQGDRLISDAVQLADRALYRAKKSGRNCVRIHDAGISTSAQDSAVA